MEYIEKTLTGIITHGTNSITFTDDFITNESIIDVYFSSDDIVPTDQEQIDNRLIISIEPQTYDVSIAVHITNDDTINYSEEIESLSNTVDEHAIAISDLAIDIDNLNASTISYDEHSTLYSAMGDIDELETTNKNLVSAINEVKESGGGQSYSTTEQVIGTWIDGKNLYRRVVMFNRSVNIGANQWNIINEVNVANIKYITRCVISNSFGTLYATDATRNISPYLNIRPYTGISIDANDSFLIVEYTKITD